MAGHAHLIREAPFSATTMESNFFATSVRRLAPRLAGVLAKHPFVDEYFLDQLAEGSPEERYVVLVEILGCEPEDEDCELVIQWEDLCHRCTHRSKHRRINSLDSLNNPARRRTIGILDLEMEQRVQQPALETEVTISRNSQGWWPKLARRNKKQAGKDRGAAVERLAELVRDLQLLVCAQLEKSRHGSEIYLRLSGGRRPKTIEHHLRRLVKARTWCVQVLTHQWFTCEAHVADHPSACAKWP